LEAGTACTGFQKTTCIQHSELIDKTKAERSAQQLVFTLKLLDNCHRRHDLQLDRRKHWICRGRGGLSTPEDTIATMESHFMASDGFGLGKGKLMESERSKGRRKRVR